MLVSNVTSVLLDWINLRCTSGHIVGRSLILVSNVTSVSLDWINLRCTSGHTVGRSLILNLINKILSTRKMSVLKG